MRDYFRKRPMLTCGMICCFMALTVNTSVKLILAEGIAVILMLAGEIFFFQKRRQIFVTVIIFLMTVSIFKTVETKNLYERYDGSLACIKAVILDTDYKANNLFISNVEVRESDILPVGTRISLYYPPREYKRGSIISADVKLRKRSGENAAQFLSTGAFLEGSVRRFEKTDDSDFVLTASEKLTDYIKSSIFDNMGYSQASTMIALLTGNREYFTDQFYGYVKNAGVAHVMVVSGMHLSVLVMLFTGIAERLIYNPFGKAAVILLTVLLLCAVCGFTVSVMRAGTTYVIMAAGIILNREISPENSLGTAVSFLLIRNPYLIFNVAFMLSVLSTFGILCLSLPLVETVKRFGLLRTKPGISFAESVSLTVSALIFTLPVTVRYFGYVSTVSVITNLLISLPVTFSIMLCIPGLIINAVFPPLAKPIFFAVEQITLYVNSVITNFGSQPFSTVDTPQYLTGLIWIIVSVIFISSLIFREYVKKRKTKIITNKIISEKEKGKYGGGF